MNGAERDRKLLQDLVEFTGMKPAKLAREAKVAVTTINRPYSGSVSTRLSAGTVDKLRTRFPYFEGWGDYLGAPPETSEAIAAAYSVEELAWLDLLKSLQTPDRMLVLQLARRLRGDGPFEPPPTPAVPEGTIDFWGAKIEREGG